MKGIASKTITVSLPAIGKSRPDSRPYVRKAPSLYAMSCLYEERCFNRGNQMRDKTVFFFIHHVQCKNVCLVLNNA